MMTKQHLSDDGSKKTELYYETITCDKREKKHDQNMPDWANKAPKSKLLARVIN